MITEQTACPTPVTGAGKQDRVCHFKPNKESTMAYCGVTEETWSYCPFEDYCASYCKCGNPLCRLCLIAIASQ